MTKEEHDILVENNRMLRQILAFIYKHESHNNDFQDFTMNVVANLVSNNLNNNNYGR